jgi:hypothetical protein
VSSLMSQLSAYSEISLVVGLMKAYQYSIRLTAESSKVGYFGLAKGEELTRCVGAIRDATTL